MSETTQVYLKGGQYALVDTKDYPKVSAYSYRKSGDEVIRNLRRPDSQGRKTRSMKHDILGRADCAVGYIDGDCLNNRRENLKIVRDPKKSHTERFRTLTLTPRTDKPAAGKFHSEVPGVTFRKDRANSKPWRARVQVAGKPYYLGHFATREEAEAVARQAYGQSA